MNSDIHQNVALTPADLDWQKFGYSEKALLDQTSWESSFLKLNANQSVSDQDISIGEEYLILEGSLTFGGLIYPSGSYFRFPPTTIHSLSAGASGALIFCKSGHFTSSDTHILAVKQSDQTWRQGMADGLLVMPLYQHHHENIALVKWAPNSQFNPHVHPGGEEIIVIEGTFHDEYGAYPQGTWTRNKPYSKHTPFTKSDGALIYVKTGHLEPLR